MNHNLNDPKILPTLKNIVEKNLVGSSKSELTLVQTLVIVQQCYKIRQCYKKNNSMELIDLYEILVSDHTYSLFRMLYWGNTACHIAKHLHEGDFVYYRNINNINNNSCFVDINTTFILRKYNNVYTIDISRFPTFHNRIIEIEDYLRQSSFHLLTR
jgi:hypothetical protein